MELDPLDLAELAYAKRLLENPGLAATLSARLGAPLEKGVTLLPPAWSASLQTAVKTALERALQAALTTLERPPPGAPPPRASNRLHRLAVTACGAAGGAFGAVGLTVELPLSTTLMLRSIADVARSEGEDLSAFEPQLACLEVFALGGSSAADDAGETGYYAVRATLAKLVADAVEHLGSAGAARGTAPVLVKLLAAIGARFGVVVSEKAAAQLLPLVGAAGGALVNNLFIGHFQNAARGHFIVRRLERRYGKDAVRLAYRRL